GCGSYASALRLPSGACATGTPFRGTCQEHFHVDFYPFLSSRPNGRISRDKYDNVIITVHMAACTGEALASMDSFVVNQVLNIA
ncbi:MAG: hypothetical protein RAK22_03010, partial [Nanoarchaeota archaeon]|nr:hypothetical protein [Nanoarchaeota archaeon]